MESITHAVHVLPVILNAVGGIGAGSEGAHQYHVFVGHMELAVIDRRVLGRLDSPAGEDVACHGYGSGHGNAGIVRHVGQSGGKGCTGGNRSLKLIHYVVLIDLVVQLQSESGILGNGALLHAAGSIGIVGVAGNGADEFRRIFHRAGYLIGGTRIVGGSGIASVCVLQIVMDMERYVFLNGEDTVQGDVTERHSELCGVIGDGGLIQGVPSGKGLVKNLLLLRVRSNRYLFAVVVFLCQRQSGSRSGNRALIGVSHRVLVAGMELMQGELSVRRNFAGGYCVHGTGNAGYGSTHHGCIQGKSFVHTGSGSHGGIGGAGAVYRFLNGIGAVQILDIMNGLVGDTGVGSEVTDQFHVLIGHGEGCLIRRDGGIGGLPAGEGVAGIGEIGSDGHVGTEIHTCQTCGSGCARVIAGDLIRYVVFVGRERAGEYNILLRHCILAGIQRHVGGGPAVERITGDHGSIRDHGLLTACQTVQSLVCNRVLGSGIRVLIHNGIGLNIGRFHAGNSHTCGVQQIGGAVVGADLAVLDQGGVGIDHAVIGSGIDLHNQCRTVVVTAVSGTGSIGNVVIVVVKAVYFHRLALHGAAQAGVFNSLRPAPGTVAVLHAIGSIQSHGVGAAGNGEEGGHGVHDLRRLTQLNGGRLDLLRDGLEDHRKGFGAGGYQIVSGCGVSARAGGIQIGRVGIVAGYVMEEFIQIGGGVIHIRIRGHADRIYLRGLLDILRQIDGRIGHGGVKAIAVVRLTVGEHQHNLIALCGARIVGIQNHLCQSQAVVDGGGAAGSQRIYCGNQCFMTVTVCDGQILNYFGIVVVVFVLVVALRKGRTAAVITVIRKLHHSDAVLKRFDLRIGQVVQMTGRRNFRILLVSGFNKGIHRRFQRIDIIDRHVSCILTVELHYGMAELAGFAGIITQARIHVYSLVIRAIVIIVVILAAVLAVPLYCHIVRRLIRSDINIVGSGRGGKTVSGVKIPTTQPTVLGAAVYCIIRGDRGAGMHVIHRTGHVQNQHDIRRNGCGGLTYHAGGIRFDNDIHRAVRHAAYFMRHNGLAHNNTVGLIGVFHNHRFRLGCRCTGILGKNADRYHRYKHHYCQKGGQNTFFHSCVSFRGGSPLCYHKIVCVTGCQVSFASAGMMECLISAVRNAGVSARDFFSHRQIPMYSSHFSKCLQSLHQLSSVAMGLE